MIQHCSTITTRDLQAGGHETWHIDNSANVDKQNQSTHFKTYTGKFSLILPQDFMFPLYFLFLSYS